VKFFCDKAPEVNNAITTIVTDNITALIQCNTGYILSGDRLFSCIDNIWTGSAKCSK